MMGVPAKQVGWMSEYGEQMPLPVKGEGRYQCPHTGSIYKLMDEQIIQEEATHAS
jgi:UDP-2-acetamido-3-amino-2,3-dideoxy-glucuronate N-acetyltransferase